MSIQIGEQVIPQINLGVNSLHKIMLGVTEIFPNLAPPVASPITIVNTQAPPHTTNTRDIPFDTTGLQVGDTAFVCTRSDATAMGALTVAGTTVTRLQFRQNGFTDSIAIDRFVVPAGMPDTGMVNLAAANVTDIRTVIIVARCKAATGLSVNMGGAQNVNATPLVVNPTQTVQEGLLIAAGVSNTTNAVDITQFSSNLPIAVDFPLPKVGITAMAVIAETPSQAIITQAAVGAGQMTAAMWVTYASALIEEEVDP